MHGHLNVKYVLQSVCVCVCVCVCVFFKSGPENKFTMQVLE